MNIFVYDKTFEGLLTLVFDSYEIKCKPDKIIDKQQKHSFLFSNIHEVITDEERAERVWKGLQQKLEKHTCQMLYHVYLTEEAEVELLLYQYMCKAFDSNHNIENDFSDISVIDVVKLGHKISREAQRMAMFVRFQKTVDDIFYSSFDPKYNVLPLMVDHFEKRFADQKWIIFDTRRKYGFYYDLKKLSEVRIENMNISSSSGMLNETVISVDEKLFQELWKTYFKELSIKERANYKLHVQHLPKRFWRYLTEKQI
jgi:probable DNA metabolism protein